MAAELLIGHGLAACVASDAHHPVQRSTHMGEIAELLAEEFGEDYARLLLEENPARILRGKDLLGYEPIPFD
jgi:protein-tyrosine phosphatase